MYEEKLMCSFEDLKQEKTIALGAATAISKKESCGIISIGSNGDRPQDHSIRRT